jgi:hypothetical protein
MATLIRFETTDERGPSGKLWGNLVDWVKGTLKVDGGVSYVQDFDPAPLAITHADTTMSADSGAAAALQAEPMGVVEYTASQAADAVSGFQVNSYVDFDATGFREAVIEVCVESVADNAANEMFVGWSDEALDGFYGTDNTPDGSSLGLRWNTDETVDLVSIASNDTVTVLKAEVATGIERTDGRAKLGVRIRKETATRYSVIASVNGVTTKVSTTTIPGAAMFPTVAMTNDNGATPAFDIDWIATLNVAAAV